MRWKVLVADDEERMLTLLAATLQRIDGCTVFLARDGNEALEVARREKPHLALLDVLMPSRDGLEVCRLLKSDPATATVKVLFLSALTQASDRQLGLEAGGDEYLIKPINPTALLAKVSELLSAAQSS